MTAYRLVLALGLLCLAPLAPAAEIHWSSCPEERPATSAAALDCGVLATEDKLAGEPVRLGLARLRYRPDRVSAAPVVFVPGGPAQPAGLGPAQISAWQRFQQQAGWPRDIVLFDPRATGDSRPEVACAADEGAKACGQRIGRSTLAGLSMSAAVDDLHALIAALDQGPVVLWAHSFGVFVARALAARYPDDMAGVVLEAPAADQQRGSDFADGAATRALERIARSCGAQACVIGVPSTRALLKAWRVALARRPVRWATARVPYPSTREQIDDDTLVAGILFSQYRPDTQSDVAARLRRALRNVQALVPIAVPVWHMGRVQTASSPA